MITINQYQAISVRLFTPKRGIWLADVVFDLDPLGIVPSGPAIITIGTEVLKGTIDPLASGKFGLRCSARVIGGGAGWSSPVDAQDFINDAGVLSTLVYVTTGAEVGEVVLDLEPSPLGIKYERTQGPASRVLDGLDWYVNALGITVVGPRIPLPMVPVVQEVLEWDPLQQRATMASDIIVTPGMILVDPRFGTATAGDVEQTFDAKGSRATVWCSTNPGARLINAVSALVREECGIAYLKTYQYRVVLEGVDGRLTLQAVTKTAGVPDAVAFSVYGPSGISAKYTPGTLCRVVFLNGDPTLPIVVGFEPGTPVELAFDAVAVKVGTGAESVALATKIDALFDVLGAWVPIATDGGAALKTALVDVLLMPPTASLRMTSD